MSPERRTRWAIDDVLARTDLAALLDTLAQPGTHNIRGRRWHCPVADHDDRHASVTVHTDHHGHERWRCWSGDHTHRGDAIDLVMVTQHTPRVDAIDWLARRAGMTPNQPLPPVQPKPRPAPARFVPLDPTVIRYAQACERILWSNGGRHVRKWLHGRGFGDDLLHANHVGADPGRQMLPRRRGLPYGASTAAVFPALNVDGDIHYVQARYLDPGGDKYDNPAGNLGSNPRLGWTRTPHSAARPGVLIVCEGIPDALTAAAAGFPAVGILGSQAPDQRVATQLARHAHDHHQRLFAIVDADQAGRAWGERLTELLDTSGTELTKLEPPIGGDLNEWARSDPLWWRADPLTFEHSPPRIRQHDSELRSI